MRKYRFWDLEDSIVGVLNFDVDVVIWWVVSGRKRWVLGVLKRCRIFISFVGDFEMEFF